MFVDEVPDEPEDPDGSGGANHMVRTLHQFILLHRVVFLRCRQC